MSENESVEKKETVEKPEEEMDSRLARAVEGLGVAQVEAMKVIMRGGSMMEAAAAGVNRTTIYNWIAEGKPLARAIQIWKQDMAGTARTRLLMMSRLATGNIYQSMKDGNVNTSLRVLEKLGILDSPAAGPTTAELKNQQKRAKAKISVIETAKAQANSEAHKEIDPDYRVALSRLEESDE